MYQFHQLGKTVVFSTSLRKSGNTRVGELAVVICLVNCLKRRLTLVNQSINHLINHCYQISQEYQLISDLSIWTSDK